jgi:hypothetical protein
VSSTLATTSSVELCNFTPHQAPFVFTAVLLSLSLMVHCLTVLIYAFYLWPRWEKIKDMYYTIDR